MLWFVILAACGGFLCGATAMAFVAGGSPEVDADRRSIARFERQRRALTARRVI